MADDTANRIEELMQHEGQRMTVAEFMALLERCGLELVATRARRTNKGSGGNV